jgi:hypothetical protein
VSSKAVCDDGHSKSLTGGICFVLFNCSCTWNVLPHWNSWISDFSDYINGKQKIGFLDFELIFGVKVVLFYCWYLKHGLFDLTIIFLPCLSLIKLENYNFGKWSQVMSNVNYFIFYEKNSVYCTYIVQMTLPCWQFCLQNTLPVVIMSFWRIFLTHNLHGIPSYLISEFIKSKHY